MIYRINYLWYDLIIGTYSKHQKHTIEDSDHQLSHKKYPITTRKPYSLK